LLSIDFLKETSPEKFTVVSMQKGKLVGMLSIIKTSHIALLFVKPEFQGMGIGKRLIQFSIHHCLEKNLDLKAVTVSSTPNSLSFYEHCGFIKIDEERNERGMRFIPMQKDLNG
jgi:GNAT superfamily N-acetyltransferase